MFLVTFILTSYIFSSDIRYIEKTLSAVCPLSPYFDIFWVKYIFRVIDLLFFWQRNVHITQIFCEINKLLEGNDAIFLFLSTETSMKDGEYQITEEKIFLVIKVFLQFHFQLLFSLQTFYYWQFVLLFNNKMSNYCNSFVPWYFNFDF